MQSAQVATLTLGQQNRFPGWRRFANVLLELRTSSTLLRFARESRAIRKLPESLERMRSNLGREVMMTS
jgi:hypothetical protein